MQRFLKQNIGYLPQINQSPTNHSVVVKKMRRSLSLEISIKSLISGLSCNKCKRMHEVLAAAFEVLHFERFSDKEEAVEEIIDLVKLKINIINNNRHNKHKNIETDCSVHSKEAGEILDRYDK